MNDSCEVFQLRSTRRLHSVGETLLLSDRLPHSLTPNNIEETTSIQFQSVSMILLWCFLWVYFKSLNWVNFERSPSSSCTISFKRKTQSARIWVCLQGFLVLKSPDVPLLILLQPPGTSPSCCSWAIESRDAAASAHTWWLHLCCFWWVNSWRLANWIDNSFMTSGTFTRPILPQTGPFLRIASISLHNKIRYLIIALYSKKWWWFSRWSKF